MDMNLIVQLDALLTERNVTRAAARLGLTQPTLSAGLRRLRAHYHDQLLVRRGTSYELTPLAQELQPLVVASLSAAERVMTEADAFDATVAQRTFSLLAADFWLADLGSLLTQELRKLAPSIQLRLGEPPALAPGGAPDLLEEWDFIVAMAGSLAGLAEKPMLTTRLVCVVDAENPVVGETLTRDDLERLPWVMAIPSPVNVTSYASTFALNQFAAAGIAAHVMVTTESALSVPALVAGTDCVGFIRDRFAETVAQRLGLRVFAPPIVLPTFVHSLFWDPRREHDRGHAWMRDTLFRIAAKIDQSSGAPQGLPRFGDHLVGDVD